MKQRPSSTSSSEPSGRSGIRSALWSLFGLVSTVAAFETVVAFGFSMAPDDQQPSGALTRYFSYGYSIESKLTRTVGSEGEQPAAIVRAGWVSAEMYPPPTHWEPSPRRVIFYGMSFTKRIADRLQEIGPEYAIVTRSGPGAPLSHSVALFDADPWRSESDFVVVGVLASSIPNLRSISGLTCTFENPAPYAYPRFSVVDGQLQQIDPPITERDQFVEAFRTHSPLWTQHLETVRTHDAYWDPFLFNASVLDRSAIARLTRRAWASRLINRARAEVYSPHQGYETSDPSLAAVPLLLRKMDADCRQNGQQLVVLLLHTLGEPGHLDTWLAEDLRAQGIITISTTDLFSSLDALNFEADLHYLPEFDGGIAEAIEEAIQTAPPRR